MAKAEIIIDIAPDGGTTVEVNGVKGKKCLDLTREFEQALGTVTKRVEKKEMNQREQSETVRLRN